MLTAVVDLLPIAVLGPKHEGAIRAILEVLVEAAEVGMAGVQDQQGPGAVLGVARLRCRGTAGGDDGHALDGVRLDLVAVAEAVEGELAGRPWAKGLFWLARPDLADRSRAAHVHDHLLHTLGKQPDDCCVAVLLGTVRSGDVLEQLTVGTVHLDVSGLLHVPELNVQQVLQLLILEADGYARMLAAVVDLLPVAVLGPKHEGAILTFLQVLVEAAEVGMAGVQDQQRPGAVLGVPRLRRRGAAGGDDGDAGDRVRHDLVAVAEAIEGELIRPRMLSNPGFRKGTPFLLKRGFIREPNPPKKKGNKGTTGHPRGSPPQKFSVLRSSCACEFTCFLFWRMQEPSSSPRAQARSARTCRIVFHMASGSVAFSCSQVALCRKLGPRRRRDLSARSPAMDWRLGGSTLKGSLIVVKPPFGDEPLDSKTWLSVPRDLNTSNALRHPKPS